MYTHKTITPLKIKNTPITPQVPDPISDLSLLPTPCPRQPPTCALSLEVTRHFSEGFHINRMMPYACIYFFLAWLLSRGTTTLRHLHADAHIDGSLLSALSNSSQSAWTPRVDSFQLS